MGQVDSYRSADVLQCVVARYYEPRFGHSFVAVGNFPDYDIAFPNGPKLEIKLDKAAEVTGNACIEYSYRNRPSGILKTSADLWIHVVPSGDKLIAYEIELKQLLRLCFEVGKCSRGGDGNLVLFKLIPLEKIKEISSQVFVLNTP
jgi:hypothetical protein